MTLIYREKEEGNSLLISGKLFYVLEAATIKYLSIDESLDLGIISFYICQLFSEGYELVCMFGG